MHLEYLLLNLIIISGPFALSFDRKVAFYRSWQAVWPAILISMLVYITWDILVAGKHWHFNPDHTLPFRLFGLPPGEWLFFITVPYACTFLWQVYAAYLPQKTVKTLPWHWLAPVTLAAGIWTFSLQLHYTTLVMWAMTGVLVLDYALKTRVFSRHQSGLFFLTLGLLILVFNGYLTARPVVLYNDLYNTGIRIFTIPVEDFIYGLSHIILTLIVFEKLKGQHFD